MKVTKEIMPNLQLFAEDGAGATDTASAGSDMGGNTQVATENTGENAQVAAEKRAAEWSKYKAEFKAEYDSEVQGVVKKRLKNAKENEEAAKAYREKTSKIFDALGVKYGIDAEKIDDILAEVEKDNSYYENEALRRGMDVAELRHLKQTEKENARMRAEKEAAQQVAFKQQIRNQMLEQAEKLKELYPNFDLDTESEANPLFKKLCALGIPLKNAYETTHIEEIMARGMQYAAQQTAADVHATAQMNKNRPAENGLGNKNTADRKVDISALSLEEMRKLNDDARRGKTITLK